MKNDDYRLIFISAYDTVHAIVLYRPAFLQNTFSGGTMKRKEGVTLILLLLFYAVLSLYAVRGGSAEKMPKQPAPPPSDCAKCHAKHPAEVEPRGARHKTITCQD